MLNSAVNSTDKRTGDQQQELFPSESCCSQESLISFLNKGLLRSVKVTFTRNRVSMLSITSSRFGSIKIRLHEKFLEADSEVHHAIKRYIRSHRKADWKIISEYARKIAQTNEQKTTSSRILKTDGVHHDLNEILKHTNQRFFYGQLKCKITWSNAPATGNRRRSIHYGSYVKAQNLIRIHPALDRPDVPRAFIEYIVFHELLHAAVPSSKINGRNSHHGATFRKLERSFPDYPKMRQLSKDLLSII